MIWLIRRIAREYPTWDRPARLALLLALLLLVPALLLALLVPQDVRPAAWFGVGMLLLVAQVAVMWGSRGLVNVFTAGQRAYLTGNLDRARSILEQARASGRADLRALTLLGNVYRQLGRLDDSEAVLYEALDKDGDHPFPLVGIGRTLLSKGDYASAVERFSRVLAQDSRHAVQVDAAEAQWRLGNLEQARALLGGESDYAEARERLMDAYLRYRLGMGDAPPRDLIEQGLVFWRAAVQRFAHTPYGHALAEDMRLVEGLLEEM
jgi:tetratricopeptide (TPR) repeat protein